MDFNVIFPEDSSLDNMSGNPQIRLQPQGTFSHDQTQLSHSMPQNENQPMEQETESYSYYGNQIEFPTFTELSSFNHQHQQMYPIFQKPPPAPYGFYEESKNQDFNHDAASNQNREHSIGSSGHISIDDSMAGNFHCATSSHNLGHHDMRGHQQHQQMVEELTSQEKRLQQMNISQNTETTMGMEKQMAHPHHHHHSMENMPNKQGAESVKQPPHPTPAPTTAPHEEQKKQNHSEIEKKRREKMNSYIKELASIIPVCSGMSRKLDKLTVLRMAVQHLKTIKGNMNTFSPGISPRPSFLSERKLHDLILKVAEGFLFVVSCDRGKFMFVTESVSQALNYHRTELLGQNWFDILHPKDVAKVKEQLTSNDLAKKEKLVDAKTMLPVTGEGASSGNRYPSSEPSFSPGARRSFFCRMKSKSITKSKDEADTTTGVAQKIKRSSRERKYVVIHCMGYIKNWVTMSTEESNAASSAGPTDSSSGGKVADTEDQEDEEGTMSCLVAVGRTIPSFSVSTCSSPSTIPAPPVEFVSRHSMDGKFLFVDQRAVFILGFLPQELLGTSNYEYCHPEDVKHLADSHRRALACKHSVLSKPYRFKTKSGSYLRLKTDWKTFENPWTREFEFIVARNVCIPLTGDSQEGFVESSTDKGHHHRSKGGFSLSRFESEHGEDSVGPKGGSSSLKSSNDSGVAHGDVDRDGGSPNSQEGGSGLKSGGSGNDTCSGGSYSETRVRKMLSSSRVNLWKIGKQIAEEAHLRNLTRSNHNANSNSSYSSSSSASSLNPDCNSIPSNLSSPSNNGGGGSSSSHSGNGGQGGSQSSGQSYNSTPTNSVDLFVQHDNVFTSIAHHGSTSSQVSPTANGMSYNNKGMEQPPAILSSLPLSGINIINHLAPSSVGPQKIEPVPMDGVIPSQVHPMNKESIGEDKIVGEEEENEEEEKGKEKETIRSVPIQGIPGEPVSQDIDEAAMALVMSLLEEEGPGDFSSLSWPMF